MGRPKLEPLLNPLQKEKEKQKLPTFSEKYEEDLKRQLFENDNVDEESVGEIILKDKMVHHKSQTGGWDVPLGEEIKYFDPELSYEITKYKPITMDQGLDFDPEPFREAAATFEKDGCYTKYPKGCKPFRDYWTEQLRRMVEGYEVNGYRITGDHYYFLNFYRMETVPDEGQAGSGRNENFPSFFSKQYEWFHYVEMAEKLHRDACALKSRGIGWSEMTAAMAVRPYTTNRKYRVLLTCAAQTKLDPLKDKCWLQLNWLNRNTNTGLKHLRQKKDNYDTKRASMVDAEGNEYGWLSEIDSVVADTADKIRGDRVDRLVFEECFGENTKVLMADYSRKNIQDIAVGDFVMGIDGTPQEVIHTCSGVDSLFKVSQRKGTDYVVNSKHKLYTEFRPRIGNHSDKIDLITAPEYLSLSDYYKRTHYGIKSSGLIRTNKHLEINPYYFGLWLGDGFSSGTTIVINETDDSEIKDFIVDYYNSFVNDNTYVTIRKNNCKTTKILNDYSLSTRNRKGSIIQKWLKTNSLIDNKHIPNYVLDLDFNDRLNILAGIIDTDGNLKKGSHSYSFVYEISMAREHLIQQIAELAKSCGFDVTCNTRIMKNGYKKGSVAYRVIIRGDISKIPVKVKRKQLPLDYHHTTNVLSTSISITPFGYGKYYGITLKSYGKETDNLFLLDDYTIVHNCGSNKLLTKSWIQGDSLVSLGGKHFGIKIALGTGGDDVALEGLADIFRNPEAFNVLPFKNYDTDDGKPEITAFFVPAHKFALDKKYLDSRGVTNYIEFKKYYEKQRSKLEGQNLLDEMAEHCFTPREALNKHGASVFDSVALSERLIQLKVQKLGLKPIPMQLLWDKTKGENAIIAKESPNSKLLVVEPPLKGPDGLPYKNLYVAGIDAIDQGTSDSASYSDVSDFCVVIMKRIFGMEEPKIVAMYKDRPSDIRAAYDLTMKLLTWYNCKAMLEYTKISIIQYFTNKNKAGLFMDRPELGSGSKPIPKRMGSKRLIGVPGTPAYINHGIELIQGFVNEFWHTIDYEEIVEQLLNYSYENKRKFDIVAALQMVLIGDEALTGVNPSTVKTVKSQWKDIGYYRDENGYLRYGVIPDNNKPVAKWHS